MQCPAPGGVKLQQQFLVSQPLLLVLPKKIESAAVLAARSLRGAWGVENHETMHVRVHQEAVVSVRDMPNRCMQRHAVLLT